MKNKNNNEFVFSYTTGDEISKSLFDKKGDFIGKTTKPSDGYVRLQLEKNSRGGKIVTVVFGFEENTDLNEMCSNLKKRAGAGGTVKDGKIEIQGDKRDLIEKYLNEKQIKTKRAGG